MKSVLIVRFIAVCALFIFSMLFLNTIRQYLSYRTDVGFLKFKQAVVDNKFWRFFFYVHVFSISLCLLVGFTQFSKQLSTEHRKLHKLFGKIYVYNIVLINFPACLVLAIFSNGGLLGRIGFVIQDFLWLYFTVSAVLAVKKQNIHTHKNFMILSYSVTTTAITFRIIKNLLYNENAFQYQLFYGIDVWAALVLNLAVAYVVIYVSRKRLSSNLHV